MNQRTKANGNFGKIFNINTYSIRNSTDKLVLQFDNFKRNTRLE